MSEWAGAERPPKHAPLGHVDLIGLQSLRSPFYDECDLRTFLQRTIAARLDGGVVNEDVLPVFPLDETKSLASVKPLHRTCFFHDDCSLSSDQNPD